ncbi:MAG: PDZ domain-containing protein [Alphaproteobacteria bacterium]|nr:PDZ domain-containing protein [Alphaproteobacteria bacterium]
MLIAALVLLVRCAAAPLPAGGSTEQLFSRGLDEIVDLYIDPVSPRRLVLSGAQHLARLDENFSVSETAGGPAGSALVLSYGGREIGVYQTPAEDKVHGWAEVVSRVIADAKAASPKLAALSQEQIDQAVFDGITGALDRFSRYSPPETARDQRAARDGFGGIGVSLDAADRDFRVSAITPHGPADRAGVRPGDVLVAVDGLPTAGRPQGEVVKQLRGPLFSRIDLTLARDGSPGKRRLRMERELIILPTVSLSRDGDIAVIRIASFNQSTTQRLVDSLAEAQRQAGGRLRGIVLDLRNNPGGLLDQAVSLADEFIANGPIIATVGRHPASRQYFAASGDGIAPQIPIVVLVNGGSASAAEIVAAALQDAGRAVVVGSSSYGKGTVQTVVRLPNDGDLTLTWARLVAPSGYILNGHGVVPTLCTSDLGDNDGAVDQGLRRAVATSAAQPRSTLDERAWAALRGACPSRHGDRGIDVRIAERVLQDPALYARAVRVMAAAAHAPQQAAVPGSDLTAGGGALSSGSTNP